ncbi:hypothetical protein B566_EDAN005277 [Ephemera danica]|nr:hypothetical protein B566_EDAN005277 [Ephemera danica]
MTRFGMLAGASHDVSAQQGAVTSTVPLRVSEGATCMVPLHHMERHQTLVLALQSVSLIGHVTHSLLAPLKPIAGQMQSCFGNQIIMLWVRTPKLQRKDMEEEEEANGDHIFFLISMGRVAEHVWRQVMRGSPVKASSQVAPHFSFHAVDFLHQCAGAV